MRKHYVFAFRNIFACSFVVSSIHTFVKATFLHFVPCFPYHTRKIFYSDLRYYFACGFDFRALLLFFLKCFLFQTKLLLYYNIILFVRSITLAIK